MNTHRIMTTMLAATLAASSAITTAVVLTPNRTPHTLLLHNPTGRGQIKPWWESITIAESSAPSTTVTALRTTPSHTDSSPVADPAPNPASTATSVTPAPATPGLVTYVVPADLLFRPDSATVDDTGRAELIDLARTQLHGAVAVVVAGATDGRGTRDHNLALSQARADAATAILVDAGIDPGIIRTQAWADDHPAADEHGPDPATAQARNRRVEITVTK